MIRLSEKQNIYLTAICFLAGFLAVVFLVINPVLAQIYKSSLVLAERKQSAEKFFANWRELENSKNSNKLIQEELSGQKTFLPKNKAVDFIMSLENLAARTGNQQEISISNPEKKAGIETSASTLHFQVKLTGSFPNMVKFLIGLENAPYFNNVNSVQIIRPASTQESAPGEIITIFKLTALEQ